MIKQAKNFAHNILLEQWENTWLKGLKFTLRYYLKEVLDKIVYQKNPLECIKVLQI